MSTIKNAKDNSKNVRLSSKELVKKTKQFFNNLGCANEISNQVQNAKAHIPDLLDIYLDNDIAGDNQDRRNKIKAVKFIDSFLITII